MGKIVSSLPEPRKIRKPPPPPPKRGRPPASNPGFESKAGVKFIQTLSQEDFSLIASKALEEDMTVQGYIRHYIIKPWKRDQE